MPVQPSTSCRSRQFRSRETETRVQAQVRRDMLRRAVPCGDLDGWRNRARHEPGAVYMFMDVRVNVLALATLNVWRRPLPQVLKQYVMDPIGASDTWRWFGYDTSWIVLDGAAVQSVSGGAHFLHTGRRALPSAPEQAFYHLGSGNNVIYVDPVNDLVIVMRWISSLRAVYGVVQRVLPGVQAQ